jgi:hypothetical protein
MEPYPYQKEGIQSGLKYKKFINADEPGLGKSQPLKSLIYTPHGHISMGKIKVGDIISTPDGQTSNVSGVYNQGERPIYKVTFNDESTTECDIEHLWCVRDRNRRNRGLGWVVKTTGELIKSGLILKPSKKRDDTGRKPVLKWEIPITQPVCFNSRTLVIPSYILGVLIGDGSLSNGNVCFSNPDFDSQILDKVKTLLPSNLKVWKNSNLNCPQFYITQTNTTKKNPWSEEIESIGLNVKSGEKSIPEKYLYNDVESRIDLLKGLMDTDGSCIKNRTVFHTTSLLLAKDVVKLVQSLGGIARLNRYDRLKEGKGIEYQVSINVSFSPFSLKRKADNWKPTTVRRYIKSIAFVGVEESRCIKVDHPDHLYVTDDYVVTHNTAQSIMTVNNSHSFPCLVICPSSLKINWQREWEMWTGKRAMILSNTNLHSWWAFAMKNPFGLDTKTDIFIVNYESLKKFFVLDIEPGELTLKKIHFRPETKIFKSIIIDEFHRCKEAGTLQSKLIKGLSTSREYVIGLTGTPVVNHRDDMIPLLSITGQLKHFGGADGFKSMSSDEIRDKLKETGFIRRLKRDVLKDLPPKTRHLFPVEITTSDEYKVAEDDLKRYLKEYRQASNAEIARSMRGAAMVKIGILKNIAARGKIEAVREHVNSLRSADQKVVLFCHLREVSDMLKKEFPKAVTVLGEDDSQTRQRSIDRFQNDPNVDVIICSIKAAGVGITLTASSNVCFIELPWHPADTTQCEDRCDRNGQKFAVQCTYFLGYQTIDNWIYMLIDKKREVANQITGDHQSIEIQMQDELIDILSEEFKI